MKKYIIFVVVILLSSVLLTACSESTGHNDTETINSESEESVEKKMNTVNHFPHKLAEIPENYYLQAEKEGTLFDLYYETYESMTYERKSKVLTKHAVVYLPAGYSEEKSYNVFYLMHGGWSDETTYLGTPGQPSEFKNIMDHAIQDGQMEPMIVVCPTYNNESSSDSSNYSLAITLTNNYHNELVNDLIPAVEGKYSTFAEDTSVDGLRVSRDHRAFCGFSMGSVATWRTFQYCLDYFRYFMPSSGNLTSDGEYLASIVKDSGYSWNDFYIFAASGTDDFAYAAFKQQIDAMAAVSDRTFRYADNEVEGNLFFLDREGGTHSGEYAMQYFYNGLCWIWNSEAKGQEQTESNKKNDKGVFTENSTVGDVINDSAFGNFGRLLFPVDLSISTDMTLEELSSSNIYLWYSDIQTDKTVEIINTLKEQSLEGKQIFYNIYSDNEIASDGSKADTGLFFFHGTPGEKFAVMNAGGGFYYVGAMHDSFPHAIEVSKKGYNAFALIYRPDYAYEDLTQAIEFVYDHAVELQVDRENYSLWGGSAGARMAATLGNNEYLQQLTDRTDILPQAAAVIMQYTGYTDVSASDAPTYACVGKNDGIANWRTMQRRLNNLENLGIPTEFHAYEGLSHGFGLGTGTVAEGWINDALAFWEKQI